MAVLTSGLQLIQALLHSWRKFTQIHYEPYKPRQTFFTLVRGNALHGTLWALSDAQQQAAAAARAAEEEAKEEPAWAPRTSWIFGLEVSALEGWGLWG